VKDGDGFSMPGCFTSIWDDAPVAGRSEGDLLSAHSAVHLSPGLAVVSGDGPFTLIGGAADKGDHPAIVC
jgi:hypothetical protein